MRSRPAVVEKLIARYPDAKSVKLLVELADLHRRAGHNEAVKSILREAMQLDPSDGSAQSRLGLIARRRRTGRRCGSRVA